MTPFRNVLAAVSSLALLSPAVAQTGRIQLNSGAQQENTVRVQVGINFFVAGPTGDSDEAQKLRNKAQRMVYEMAGHECDLLRQVLAKDCRVENVNVNLNATGGRQFNQQQQQEGFNLNGSMSLQITLK